MTTATYLGSGDVSRHRRDNLADDVTMEGSVQPLGSVLLWSQVMGEHFAGTRYARSFMSAEMAGALEEVGTR